jgi:uncharacterized protein DUF222
VVLDAVTREIDRLVAMDPAELANPDAQLALHGARARLEAVAARSAAAFESSGAYAADGARSAAHWLGFATHRPVDAAQRQVRLGAALAELPLVEEAWLAGEISECHVAAIAGRRTVNPEAMARDEGDIVWWAAHESFSGFLRGLKYWTYENDPDFGDGSAARIRSRRQLFCKKRTNGMLNGHFDLDPLGGEIFLNEFLRIEHALFEEDWGEARDRLGDDATVDDLRRTAAQRRADALVEMAERSAAMPADAQRPQPLFSVFIGWETFHGMLCRLGRGDAVAPGALVPWLEKAWIERVVFEGPSRVIDVGAQRRFFSGATRRAVELRDQECFHDFCEVPAVDAQIDHVQPYSFGGPTIQANGRVACGPHNRDRHKRPPP